MHALGHRSSTKLILSKTLVNSVLLRPHPTEAGETMLSSVSHVYVQVEQTRRDILQWIRPRWGTVLQEGGFENVEAWALKEISHGMCNGTLRSTPADCTVL